MKTVCIYHGADLDGHCSGAIAKMAYPEARLVPLDYGDEVPWHLIDGRTRVVLADFSLQPWDDMQRLAAECARLIWIDHHRTAIDNFEKHGLAGRRIVTVLDDRKAACELAWEYFRDQGVLSTLPLVEFVPLAVTLLGRYDVWDLDYNKMVLPFQMGMRLQDTDPRGDFEWRSLFENQLAVDAHVSAGRLILSYQDRQNARLMDSAFEYTWRGLDLLCVNAGGINSMAFESRYDPDRHDAVLAFYYNGERNIWTFSLYSPDQKYAEDPTLSGIAKSMGGGGHNCACGFQTVSLTAVFERNLNIAA